MICKNCNTEFNNGMFCPKCTAAVEQTQEASGQTDFSEQTVFAAHEYTPDSSVAVKKSRKGLAVGIIAAVVILLAAVFCVLSFTDIIIKKENSFVSLFNDFTQMDFDRYEDVLGNAAEANLSVTLNADSTFFATSDIKELVEYINGLDVLLKVGNTENDTRGIISVLDKNGEILGVEALQDKEGLFFKPSFSDVTIVRQNLAYYATENLTIEKIDEDLLEKMYKSAEDTFKGAFEESDFVKGTYSGQLSAASGTRVITVKMSGEKFIDVMFDSLVAAVKTEGFKDYYEKNGRAVIENLISQSEIESDDMLFDFDSIVGYIELLRGRAKETDLSSVEIQISVLYEGSISFSRKALGVSVYIAEGEESGELAVYSNEKNKSVLGIYSVTGDKLELVNDYTKAGKAVKGKITVNANGELQDGSDISMLNGIYADYEIGEDGKSKLDIHVTVENEELVTVTLQFRKTDSFEVSIDKSNSITMEDISMELYGSTPESSEYKALLADTQKWLTDLQERPVIGEIIQYLMYYYEVDDDYVNPDFDFDTYDMLDYLDGIDDFRCYFLIDNDEEYYISHELSGLTYVDIIELMKNGKEPDGGDLLSKRQITVYFESESDELYEMYVFLESDYALNIWDSEDGGYNYEEYQLPDGSFEILEKLLMERAGK